MRNLRRVAHLGSESGKRLGSSSTQPYISRGAVAVDLGVLIASEDPCKIQGKAPGKVTDLPAYSTYQGLALAVHCASYMDGVREGTHGGKNVGARW